MKRRCSFSTDSFRIKLNKQCLMEIKHEIETVVKKSAARKIATTMNGRQATNVCDVETKKSANSSVSSHATAGSIGSGYSVSSEVTSSNCIQNNTKDNVCLPFCLLFVPGYICLVVCVLLEFLQ